MLLINKKGFAEINCKKSWNVIKIGFSPTQLTATFNKIIDIKNDKITPIWVIQCSNIEYFDIKESNDNMSLLISTLCDNIAGEIIKIILVDKEQNYLSDSIELQVISL